VKVVDTNLLLYSVNADAPQHGRCRAWLENALAGDEIIGFDWIVVAGFLRIATSPRVFPQPFTVQEAVQQASNWLSAPVARNPATTGDHWTILEELLLAVGTARNLATDAHLASLAISHNATLVSCDTDFARFRRLKWENPLAVP
jgi:toxin-antitoxin system PIN domain toxin